MLKVMLGASACLCGMMIFPIHRGNAEYPPQVVQANNSASSGSASQLISLVEYRESEHWRSMMEKLSNLKKADYRGDSLPQLKYDTIDIPLVDGEPSLLLHG